MVMRAPILPLPPIIPSRPPFPLWPPPQRLWMSGNFHKPIGMAAARHSDVRLQRPVYCHRSDTPPIPIFRLSRQHRPSITPHFATRPPAIPRNARNEVSQRYANRTTRQTRNSDKARRAHAADSDVAALQAELSETREELAGARSDAKAERSAETTGRVRELEATVVDIEGKRKLARAEAKSSSSGRVRAPRASASAATSNETSHPASASGPAPAPASGATTAPLTISSVAADAMDSDIAGGRPSRVSARKRTYPVRLLHCPTNVRRRLWIRWLGG
ncbi:hypothetical protein C8J57DRAFT_1319724 [Mycena rebaudengoi]|nr:hypothetical protein C8J57DRAFT_1319724 [Mycena rebaudengoi]